MAMRLSGMLPALVAAALAATACSGDSNAPDNSFIGSYGLVSVDGDPLPITIIDQPGLTVTLSAGALRLDRNDSFTQTSTLVTVVDGVPRTPELLSCTGHSARSGNSFTLTAPRSSSCTGDTLTGTRDGNMLTFSDTTGETLVFRR
jgi:hypothetical protein